MRPKSECGLHHIIEKAQLTNTFRKGTPPKLNRSMLNFTIENNILFLQSYIVASWQYIIVLISSQNTISFQCFSGLLTLAIEKFVRLSVITAESKCVLLAFFDEYLWVFGTFLTVSWHSIFPQSSSKRDINGIKKFWGLLLIFLSTFDR